MKNIFKFKLLYLLFLTFSIFGLFIISGCGKTGGTLDIYSVVEAPIFSPPAGTYTSAQVVSISCPTPGAEIYYTLDDSEPKKTSTKYTGPITVSSTVKIKAKAYLDPKIPSVVTSSQYIITGTVATPTFSPEAGTYSTPQSVKISCLTSGAKITYTLDGTDPNITSAVYENPINIASTTTIKAKAFLEDYASSEVASATYYIGQTSTPIISPSSDTFKGVFQKNITISSEPGSTIYYTLDGSTPTLYSSSGSSPLTIELKLDSNTPVKTWQVKAFAKVFGKTESQITTETYTLSLTTEATVVDSGNVGEHCSIAIDSSNRPHICYFDKTGKIKYSFKNSGVWTTPVVIDNSVGINGGYTDIAIFSNTIHVVYYDAANGILKHAYSTTFPWTSWNVNTIATGIARAFPKISLNPLGNPSVTYYESNPDKKVKLAYSSASPWNSWSFIEVSENQIDDDNKGRSSNTIDSSGYIYILFQDNGKIKSKTNAPLGNYSTKEVVDNYSGYYLDIALGSGVGSNRKVYAVFCQPQLTLSKSFDSAASWSSSTTTISSSTNFQFLSLAVNSSGSLDILHLSAYDNSYQNLKYFTDISGEWEEFCLDNNAKCGAYCSIALDQNGYFHVCYFDELNGRLKYATNRP